MTKSINTASKKSISPDKESRRSPSPAKVNVAVESADVSRLTYQEMIVQLFVEDFNKSKKLKTDGVTYQQVWKSMSERWPLSKKELCLKRLKTMAAGADAKKGKLEKNEKGKYKFTANEILKPK